MTSLSRKIERLRDGQQPRILDLFSGCGGISVGMQRAGGRVIAGLDADMSAMESWYLNLRPDLLCRLRAAPSWDITQTDPEKFFGDLGIPEMADEIDILVGGPPCQAYSRIGKGKLRSLGGEDAHLFDERGSLYREFLRFVKAIQPVALLIENVPDSTNYGGENIPELVCTKLQRMGYTACWTLLQAAEYGVPQFRQRVFIQAIHNSAGIHPRLPLPTHRILRTEGQRVTKDRAESLFEKMLEGEHAYYVRPQVTHDGMPPAIGTFDALSDLPVIKPLALGKGQKLDQDPATLRAYESERPRGAYQRLMRNWPNFSTDGWVSGNTIRDNPRDFPIMRRMKEGDLYPEAVRIAKEILAEKLVVEKERLRRELTAAEIAKIEKATVPPYATDKFEGKWTKFRREQPSHTVVAHLQFDTYSHIHYDSDQARAITVREAARLQSFPDGFRFAGNMGAAFKQIGNAVPPMLAAAIGKTMVDVLAGRDAAEMAADRRPLTA